MDKLKKQDDEARKKKQVALILCTETDPHSISGKRQKHFTYGDAHTRAYEHGGLASGCPDVYLWHGDAVPEWNTKGGCPGYKGELVWYKQI